MMNHRFQGRVTRQAHKGIPEGLYEEEQGRQGFFGPVSHLYRSAPSTRWISIEGPLKPHMFDLHRLPQLSGQWLRLFFNPDLAIYWFFQSQNSDSVLTQAFRNGDGETLYFCHQGQGAFFTEYGMLPFEAGQYVLIPKSVAHVIRADQDSFFLIVEGLRGPFREPDRGVLGRHGLYDQMAWGIPDLDRQWQAINSGLLDVREIRIKKRGQLTTFKYSQNAFDVVGWKGDYYPVSLHMRDIMPILSARVHLPPSAHTTLVGSGFVVCSFLPRPLESDSDALKVPFYHQNIDYDEILFYHNGKFFSRDDLNPGYLSFHPAGFPHGPHPKAIQSVSSKTHTDEMAVMIDCLQPLEIDSNLQQAELTHYWQSWLGSSS